MLLFLLSLVSCENATSFALAPQFLSSAKTVAQACTLAPLDGDVWYIGRADEDVAKYEWPIDDTGCYLVEALYPQSCENTRFSAVPFHLNGIHTWSGLLNQTNSRDQWEKMGHFKFEGGSSGVMTIGGTSDWIAPHIRVSRSNGCTPPVVTMPPLSDHAITLTRSGCYLLEVRVTRDTMISVTHNGMLAQKPLTDARGSVGAWEPLTVRMFHVADTALVEATHPCELRMSYVGRICRALRSVKVHMEGTFEEAALAAVQNAVLNVVQETQMEAYRILVKSHPRLVDGGIDLELYMIGMEGYRANMLCALTPETECEATVVEKPYDDIVFVDASWVVNFRYYYYALVVLAVAIFLCYILLCLYCAFLSRAQQRSMRQGRLQATTESVVGVVVRHDICAELVHRQEVDLEKGANAYVIGLPLPPRD